MAIEVVAVRRMRRAPYLGDENQRFFFHEFQADFEKGVGVNGDGDADDVTPLATLRWSDDRGNTWSSGITKSIGKMGEYRTRVIWRRLGRSRARIFELVTHAKVRIAITDAYLELSQGAH
jgi:hypothetical protein